MPPAEQYRKSAAQLRAKARYEESRWLRAEWERFASCYGLLADRSDRNSRGNVGQIDVTDKRIASRRRVIGMEHLGPLTDGI
jgi:hypothetical protein